MERMHRQHIHRMDTFLSIKILTMTLKRVLRRLRFRIRRIKILPSHTAFDTRGDKSLTIDHKLDIT